MYPLTSSQYECVDAVFNNLNFWINMKPECEVKDLNFDEMDSSLNWEYVMLDTLVFNKGNNQMIIYSFHPIKLFPRPLSSRERRRR